MQEQEKQEKVLQLINLFAVNKFAEKMLASKTKKVKLAKQDGPFEFLLLEDLANLASLENSNN